MIDMPITLVVITILANKSSQVFFAAGTKYVAYWQRKIYKYVTRTSAGEGGKLAFGAVLESSWKLLKEQDPFTHHQKTSNIHLFIFHKIVHA